MCAFYKQFVVLAPAWACNILHCVAGQQHSFSRLDSRTHTIEKIVKIAKQLSHTVETG
jgi:hypothetical protein